MHHIINQFYAAISEAGIITAETAEEWKQGVLEIEPDDLDEIMEYTQSVFRKEDESFDSGCD